MNRQTQNPRIDRIDGALLYTGRPGPAPVLRPKTYLRPPMPPVTTQPAADDAARERQEALDFLHKLVMGA